MGEQPVSAAEAYLDALDRRPGHKKAGEGLERTAEGACFALLIEAERREKAGDWAGAAQGYEGLSAFLARLARHGRPSCTSVDAAAKAAEMHDRAAAALYDQGRAVERAGAWEEAIGFYLQAQRHRPGYRDTDARLARARYVLAGQRQRIGQYRAAAALYLEAAESLRRARVTAGTATAAGTGAGAAGEVVDVAALRDAPERAGRIYLGLGRWFIGRGACRQAVEDLERARGLLGGAKSTVEADLARAQACATLHLFPVPLENRAGELAGPLAAELSRIVPLDAQRRGSRYLAWHSVGGLPPIGGDWVWRGVEASPEAQALRSTGTELWLLAGQVTSFAYTISPAETRREQVIGQETYPCEATTCTRDIVIEYTRVEQSVALEARIDLFLLQPTSARRTAAVNASHAVGDQIEYATDAVARVSAEATAWTMPGDLAKLLEARQALRTERELVREIAPALSEAAVRELIAEIDAPTRISDPTDVPELAVK